MPRAQFLHVETWVFDLDETLYPPEWRLFDQIEARMTDYVMRALGVGRDRADSLRAQYWSSYGTTLAGLMAEHGLDPLPYLEAVHDIDLSAFAPIPALDAALAGLPGRRIVYTNGSRRHAERVTEALGIASRFDALYGFEDADFTPKPRAEAFARVFALDGLDPARAAMFEDDPRNLVVPHGLGMRTVLVAPETTLGRAGPTLRHADPAGAAELEAEVGARADAGETGAFTPEPEPTVASPTVVAPATAAPGTTGRGGPGPAAAGPAVAAQVMKTRPAAPEERELAARRAAAHPHVHHRTHDLAAFLSRLV